MSIISTSGKINSGKDTVGKIIRILTASPHFTNEAVVDFLEKDLYESEWQIKKFADKLKDIVCMLLGCTREQLEDREFKEKELGEEWHKYQHENGQWYCTIEHYNSLTKNRQAYWSLIKLTPRLLLQLLGTECGRGIIHPNIWVNALMSGYKKYKYAEAADGIVTNKPLYKYPNWIITDMRFPNELKAVEDRKGITIRVNRSFKHKVESAGGKFSLGHDVTPLNEHESEKALDNAKFDYVIDNDSSIEELIDKVREILIKEKLL